MKFSCLHCEQRLEVSEELVGQTFACPACGQDVTVPQPAMRTPIPQAKAVAPRASAGTAARKIAFVLCALAIAAAGYIYRAQLVPELRNLLGGRSTPAPERTTAPFLENTTPKPAPAPSPPAALESAPSTSAAAPQMAATQPAPAPEIKAYRSAAGFLHPGLSHTQADLERMRKNLGEEPYKTAFAAYARLGYSAFTNTGQGPTVTGNQFVIRNDAQVAYNNAVMWFLTGDAAFRSNAIQLMNGWAKTLVNFDPNDHLTAGEAAKNFCEAGEIIRVSSSDAWAAADVVRFQKMLVEQLLPALLTPGNSLSLSTGLLEAAGHGASQVAGLLAMGIFCDRKDIYDFAIASLTRSKNTSYGMLEYINANGQTYENSRDVGHSAGNLGNYVRLARIAWNQGLDLFTLGDNRLAKAYELQAKFDLGWDVAPIGFTAPDGTVHTRMSGDGRTTRDGLAADLALYFLGKIKGLKLPYTYLSACLKYPHDGWALLDLMEPATGQLPVAPLVGEPAAASLRLYEDYLCGSYITNLPPGRYNLAALAKVGVRRGTVTSARVPIGWSVQLYEGDDFKGKSIVLTGTLENSGIYDLKEIGWNDRPTSVVITGGGTAPVFNSTYKLVARQSGQVAQVAANGSVQQSAYVGAVNQLWRVEATGKGEFKLVNLQSNQALQASALPNGQLEAATYLEWANLATGGRPAASGGSSSGGEAPAQAFDRDAKTKWSCTTPAAWLSYRCAERKVVDQYRITSANDVDERDPRAWQFEGSDDGTTWVPLDTQLNQRFASRFQTQVYSFTNNRSFAAYRLNVTANRGGSTFGLQLAELALYSSQAAGTQQRWRITPAPGAPYGTYLQLLNVKTGNALSVSPTSPNEPAPLIQTPINGGNLAVSQQWTLQVP